MKQGLFVTGTDTGIGKTVVSALLAAALREAGATAGYFKVVQTGTESDTATVGSLAPGVALAGRLTHSRFPPLLRAPLLPKGEESIWPTCGPPGIGCPRGVGLWRARAG